MAAIFTDNPVQVRADENDSVVAKRPAPDTDEALEVLGVWLSGLRSFHRSGRYIYGSNKGSATDVSRDFQIAHAGLTKCSIQTNQIISTAGAHGVYGKSHSVDADNLKSLSATINDAIAISEILCDSKNLGPSQWLAWSDILSRELDQTLVVDRLIRNSELSGERFLPKPLAALSNDPASITPETAEIILILPRFAMVLRWLNVVGKMLERDEPLKPALLIFSRVNELVSDLTCYINNRLDKFPDPDAELFATLDAASYTASIELKKVYSQELAGIAEMRPTPSIYARMETAHSLLNDGFQQILAGLTRIIEPETEIVDLFPEFQLKLEHSLVLRSDLWLASEVVRDAENQPDLSKIERMQQVLRDFMNGSMQYLFYKDTETVERFIEEILVTSQTKDLVPILHRFGAYLETLFGQVSLRAVLANRPFEKP